MKTRHGWTLIAARLGALLFIASLATGCRFTMDVSRPNMGMELVETPFTGLGERVDATFAAVSETFHWIDDEPEMTDDPILLAQETVRPQVALDR